MTRMMTSMLPHPQAHPNEFACGLPWCWMDGCRASSDNKQQRRYASSISISNEKRGDEDFRCFAYPNCTVLALRFSVAVRACAKASCFNVRAASLRRGPCNRQGHMATCE